MSISCRKMCLSYLKSWRDLYFVDDKVLFPFFVTFLRSFVLFCASFSLFHVFSHWDRESQRLYIVNIAAERRSKINKTKTIFTFSFSRINHTRREGKWALGMWLKVIFHSVVKEFWVFVLKSFHSHQLYHHKKQQQQHGKICVSMANESHLPALSLVVSFISRLFVFMFCCCREWAHCWAATVIFHSYANERAQKNSPPCLCFCNQQHFILLQNYHPLTKQLRLCSRRRWEISLNNPFLSSAKRRGGRTFVLRKE